MLDGLFDEGSVSVATCSTKGAVRKDAPPSPRKSNSLCGIYNQGATCFLNSLIQTLLMTPEFRESLFGLTEDELGSIDEKDKPGSKVRIIPIQLQKLFTKLLLLNVEGVSTEELTSSFGWNSQDCVVQHDVQELNRILFSAIEDSLIGTSGEHLIKDLYHGTIVNQIICDECHRVSEREEDFLDLCVTVTGSESLEQSLSSAYVCMESLDGANKYKCDGCKRLVNAKKGAKIRHLPAVLTVSLLRFSFDYKKLERFKETGKFSFPRELDMGSYCETNSYGERVHYELFSVVIHRGSTHGGHYHCYIRDVDGLGNWSKPDEQEIQLPVDPATGKVDYIEFDSPLELLQAILAKSHEPSMPVDKLCAELSKQTGVSWNKRFKSKHGPINKFLKKYDDKFYFDQTTNHVSLRSYSESNNTKITDVSATQNDMTSGSNKENNSDCTEERKTRNSRPKSPPPEPGYWWFDYDDSRIAPIRGNEIEKQFSGKESAYMLFYRRKTMLRPDDAFSNPLYKIPMSLVDEVLLENDKLENQRKEYELKVNVVTVMVHFSQLYSYARGALEPISPSCACIEVTIDRRKTIQQLRHAIQEVGGELMIDDFVIHTAKELPAGLHLYDCVSEDSGKLIRDCGIQHEDNLFVWDGQQISGDAVFTGSEFEPIYLNVTSCNNERISQGFASNLLASSLVDMVTEPAADGPINVQLCKVVSKGDCTECIALTDCEMQKTLTELKFSNGDSLVCQFQREKPSEVVKPRSDKAFQQVKLYSYVVELRSQCVNEKGNYPVINVQVGNNVNVAELKRVVTSQGQVTSLRDGGRLRIDHTSLGLRPPLHEQPCVEAAGLKSGTRLVLEHGRAPTSNQITLTFTSHEKAGTNIDYTDIMVDKAITVDKCLNAILKAAAITDDNWHIRKTNVFQEATQVLDDLDMTLDECGLHDGDLVLLEEGRLPPKGFLKLEVYLFPSPPSQQNDIISYVTDGVKALFSSIFTGDQTPSPVLMGEVVISKQASLEELKLQIMTLPSFSGLSVPTTNFLRVRLLENNQLSTVLKGETITLQRLKVNSSSQWAVQVLDHEEILNGHCLVLDIVERVTKSRSYKTARELIWNTKDGTTPQAMRQAVADLLLLQVDQVAVYKYIKNKYEWSLISDNTQKNKQNKAKQKGQKTNIKNSPYSVKDGDMIGAKNLQLDPYNKDGMSTVEDEQGKARLQEEAHLKKQQREENRAQNNAMDFTAGPDTQHKKREERAIKIHVDNFT